MSTHLDWLDDEIQSLKDLGYYNPYPDHQFAAGRAADDRRSIGPEFLLQQLPRPGQSSAV